MAFPEGAQESLKSDSASPLPKAASVLLKISGLISDLTAAPPLAGAVQMLRSPEMLRSPGVRRTQTEILLPSGCHAADIPHIGAVISVKTSRGSLPSSFTT